MNPKQTDFSISASQLTKRAVSLSILILLLTPFQLYSLAVAGQNTRPSSADSQNSAIQTVGQTVTQTIAANPSDVSDTEEEVLNNILGLPPEADKKSSGKTPAGKKLPTPQPSKTLEVPKTTGVSQQPAASAPPNAPTGVPASVGASSSPSASQTTPQAAPNATDGAASPSATSNAPAGTAPAEQKPQKRFSFLDADAASVLAPEFDYGVYSLSLRILDGYRRRVNEAVEAARQLAIEIPNKKVDAILMEAQTHKRRFESLYLGNQTQEGLNEFGQAKRLLMQALGLTSNSPQVEGRAIWLDRSTIIDARNPEGVRKLVQKLHRAGINTVYFETINAGYPIYPSKLVQHNPLVKGWDPLAAAVQEGHRLGMEVHAWVWVFAVGNRRHNPLVSMPSDYPGPILQEAGMMSEALRNRDGGLSVDMRQNEFWLSPASPKAREFLINLYKEIVTNYDVDGIHLDYIRYPFQSGSTRMGFEAAGRERFRQSTGRSLDTMDDYTARLWVAWKTYQINSFVQQVSENLKRMKPSLQISAAVFPMRRDSRILAIQQDWETWINNGWVDTLSPMSYTTDPNRLQDLFEFVQSSPQKRPLIYPGVALSRLDGGQLVFQVEALREKGSLGSTLFAGAHLDADKIDALGNGPFKQQGSLPPHRDVVKSLQTILADYQQKFDRLTALSNGKGIAPDQVKPVQDALNAFNESLKAIGSVKTVTEIPPFKLQNAQQQLKNMQSVTDVWLSAERTANPFRAEYFDKNYLRLSELLGYLVDKNAGIIAGSANPGFSPAAIEASPVVNPASTITGDPSDPATDDPMGETAPTKAPKASSPANGATSKANRSASVTSKASPSTMANARAAAAMNDPAPGVDKADLSEENQKPSP